MMACSLPLQMALQTSLMKEEEHGSVAVPVTSLCKQCKEEKLKHRLLQSKLSEERLLTDTVCLPSLSSAQQSGACSPTVCRHSGDTWQTFRTSQRLMEQHCKLQCAQLPVSPLLVPFTYIFSSLSAAMQGL